MVPLEGARPFRAWAQSAMAAMSLSAGVRLGLVMCLWWKWMVSLSCLLLVDLCDSGVYGSVLER